jgi:hypothetical protein
MTPDIPTPPGLLRHPAAAGTSARACLAVLLLLALAACGRNASDQPSGETTAAMPAVSATDGGASTASLARATDAGIPAAPSTVGATAADATQMSTDAAAAARDMVATGQSDPTLEADLQHCAALEASQQATCRADAHGRYAQRAASGDAPPPTNTP